MEEHTTPIDVLDCISGISDLVKKGELILRDLYLKYPCEFYTETQLSSWQFEYKRITMYLGIAFDYVSEAAKGIRQAQLMLEHNDDGR